MVCKLPSVRSLSKARREGALRENMAKAAMSASVKEMSPWSRRGAGIVSKPLRTEAKSASAERCLRTCGATMDMEQPPYENITSFKSGGIVALQFTKGQCSEPGDHWA